MDDVRASPADEGSVRTIVRRPRIGEREVLLETELDLVAGLVGDGWSTRGSSRTPDGSPHPGMQITLINARAIALVVGSEERWPLTAREP